MSIPSDQLKKSKLNLSKELIIESSLSMIEENGIDGFSLRKLAHKLNCEAMSIYYHMKNKDQIFDQIVDHLISKITFENQKNNPKEQLISIARQWRRLAQQHPNFFPILAVHPLNTKSGNHFMNQILMILEAANLSQKQASYFLRVINYYLIGVGIDEAKGYHLAVKQNISDEDALLAKAKSYWTIEDQNQIFELGLNILLNSIFNE